MSKNEVTIQSMSSYVQNTVILTKLLVKDSLSLLASHMFLAKNISLTVLTKSIMVIFFAEK